VGDQAANLLRAHKPALTCKLATCATTDSSKDVTHGILKSYGTKKPIRIAFLYSGLRRLGRPFYPPYSQSVL
jgi:hypothetical protein